MAAPLEARAQASPAIIIRVQEQYGSHTRPLNNLMRSIRAQQGRVARDLDAIFIGEQGWYAPRQTELKRVMGV